MSQIPPEAFPAPKRRFSVILKILLIGLLMLILLIPTLMTRVLVDERRGRQDEASREVMASWAHQQTVAGPIIVVPYQASEFYTRESDGYSVKQDKTYYAYFLPEKLTAQAEVKVEERALGIFKVPIYTAQVQLKGEFAKPDFSKLGILPKKIFWDKAFVRLGLSDTKGIRDNLQIDWDGKTENLKPASGQGEVLKSGVDLAIDLSLAHPSPYTFSTSFKLAGTQSLNFLPVGKETEVAVHSNWPHPQFSGEFLPENREINAQGFSADWKVVEMARGFPQAFTSQDSCARDFCQKTLGIQLLKPVDVYSLSDRSLKYALLFIFFTFVAFFLFEVLGNLRIHPIQYILVGLALCVFYVVLLSLSEHISFAGAYAIATLATVGLISFYLSIVLKKKTRVVLMSALLSGLYAFLYVLLQLEDFALLFGSLGLFLMLASVMFLTRKINWYEVGES